MSTREASSRRRVRFLISGSVQGVGFRYAAVREARRRGLDGWVRNLPDGRVELEAQGEPEALRGLADWCRNGPPVAHVVGVQEAEVPVQSAGGGFDVRW